MPALLIDRLLKVATPLTAATVSVPPSVPLPGFAPRAIVTLELFVGDHVAVGVLDRYLHGRRMPAPAAVLLGWVLKTSWLAAAGVMLNAAEVAPLRLPSAAVRV